MAEPKTYDQLLKDVQLLQKRVKDLEGDQLSPGQVLLDPLTGLLNRDSLPILGAKEVARGRRYGHPVSLILLELDDFSNLNKRYGAENGDLILRRVANVIGEQIRMTDLLFRSGEYQFLTILPETDIRMAQAFAERCLAIIAEIQFPLPDNTIHITACGGAATLFFVEIELDTLLAHAKTALAAAQALGTGNFSAYHE